MTPLTGYLRLMRPANIVTAVSDVLAGVAIAGSLIVVMFPDTVDGASLGISFITHPHNQLLRPVLMLMLSTACLYGGGVVLNDVFDAALDKTERPERPIPSGAVGKQPAAVFGVVLLLAGVFLAMKSSPDKGWNVSASLAGGIALAAVVYDKWGKHHRFLGPLNMGLCRALNLLLGMSLMPYALDVYGVLALVPMIYIAAITMISRGEVHGGKRTTLYFAALLYTVVVIAVLYVALLNGNIRTTFLTALLFSALIFPALQGAIVKPAGDRIGKAVKAGVIGLIVMNACWAAAFGDIILMGMILLLLPVSLLLARLFAVT